MNTVDPKIVRRLEKIARVQGFLSQSQIVAIMLSGLDTVMSKDSFQ